MARFTSVLAEAAKDEFVSRELSEKLQGGGDQMVLESLLGIQLKVSGMHALVFSMMRRDHLEANIRAVESCRFTVAELKLIHGRLLQYGGERAQQNAAEPFD